MSVRACQLAADAVLFEHFAFVAFVLGGFLFIWIGHVFRCGCVRNFTFRLLHLMAMGVVFLQAMLGTACPLTILENALRLRAGETTYRETFMQHWFGRVMFHEWSQTTFIILYAAFFTLIAATFLVVPPRWPWRCSTPASPSAK
jgi:hypothetical protein